MDSRATQQSQLHCLLIGIDHYLPHTQCSPLHGCVRDVRQFEMYFLSRLKHTQKHVHTLIAPHPGKDEPLVPAHQQPTYANMVAALQSIINEAQAGDLAWIYYAGHGARIHTQYEEVKGKHGVDEVLVPVDTGKQETRYLRDVELGYLLKAMVDKGLIVTLVLDCCHSGGATRGNEYVAIRGVGSLDAAPHVAESLVASPQALSESWQTLQQAGTRGFEISSGWLPQPEGYVLLAACRDFEGARESQLYHTGHNGVFTYYLLDCLRQMSPGSTYKMLYDRVRAKVHAVFTEQTPQLEGERNRVVFGSEILEESYTVNVLGVQPQEDQHDYLVELDAGQLHTLQEGAQFWVYPNPVRVSTITESEQRLAHLEISELGATTSRAVISPSTAQRIEAGDQAVLITPGPLRLSRKVRLVRRKRLPQSVRQDWALGNVEAVLRHHTGAFIRLVEPGEVPDFLVMITPEGSYELQSPDGQTIPYLRPELPITMLAAAEKLVGRLVHLAKYRNVLLLENQSGHPSIVGKLHLELHRKQENESTRLRSEAGTSPLLEPGEKVDLVVSNTSWSMLHVAVLDLAHDWSIQQLYPQHDTFAIALGEAETIPLQAQLDHPYREGTDTLKAFAASRLTDFSGLTLPPLDQPQVRLRSGGPRNALEELLDAFLEDAPARRGGFRVLGKAEWEWTSVQVEISIRRR